MSVDVGLLGYNCYILCMIFPPFAPAHSNSASLSGANCCVSAARFPCQFNFKSVGFSGFLFLIPTYFLKQKQSTVWRQGGLVEALCALAASNLLVWENPSVLPPAARLALLVPAEQIRKWVIANAGSFRFSEMGCGCIRSVGSLAIFSLSLLSLCPSAAG